MEEGSKVVVETVYTVKRILDPAANGAALVTCTDKYGDRVVTFRRQELKILSGE